ncbi:hypothetical protein BWQ96_05186 [Gracilariopsis chorda]|uniref:Uncharacterized protein n=1 Tax=Gracilariopsis chorda TaxID=448386 RepID=A0A2V3ISE2_9FLOR|nr:hypothetical protein BWQ96_05186 [Gracilariopsis chorda]|eukprot:PXF45045.1 hypothetical protein BWQ96_05186 [Gracilariopsis chorda]
MGFKKKVALSDGNSTIRVCFVICTFRARLRGILEYSPAHNVTSINKLMPMHEVDFSFFQDRVIKSLTKAVNNYPPKQGTPRHTMTSYVIRISRCPDGLRKKWLCLHGCSVDHFALHDVWRGTGSVGGRLKTIGSSFIVQNLNAKQYTIGQILVVYKLKTLIETLFLTNVTM